MWNRKTVQNKIK